MIEDSSDGIIVLDTQNRIVSQHTFSEFVNSDKSKIAIEQIQADMLADLMALWVILACIYFIFRRLLIPEVKQVTRPIDFGLLIILLLTFLTGFLAYHQWGPYRPILILHIFSSAILLVVLPFSKLGHMLFFCFSRAYMGSEFGKHLKARDW